MRRVLLEVFGEGLCAADGAGYDAAAVRALAAEIAALPAAGVRVAVVSSLRPAGNPARAAAGKPAGTRIG